MEMEDGADGYEAWTVGKILSEEKINKEAVYRVLHFLWFTKDPISFLEMEEGLFLVKFGIVDEWERILNMAP